MYQGQKEDIPVDEEATDFGLVGKDPDCRTYLVTGVTTMDWLKSHHLLFV